MKQVEQIDIEGKKVVDFDENNSCLNNYVEIFKSLEFEKVLEEAFEGHKKIIKCLLDNKKYIFLIANITYLGNPHPIFKKRVQLKGWWKDVYDKYNNEYEVLFLGLYKYRENIIFVDFNTEDYVHKKMNNSSAHIFINDIYQAMNKKHYLKRDSKNNTINVIRKVYFTEYLKNRVSKFDEYDDEVIAAIASINQKVPFNKELHGEDCYKEMINSNYSKKFEAEWPGFYLEYVYEKILKEDIPIEILSVNDISKKKGELDFDLYSSKYDFYSDLKASDNSRSETPLNDKLNIINALETKGKIWYIIYEHTTIKDKEYNYKVCEYWNTKINEIQGRNKLLTSYSSKMKGSINFKNMIILEVNKINASEILREFNQGKNSNGKERKGKFKIKKKDIENYIIYRYGE